MMQSTNCGMHKYLHPQQSGGPLHINSSLNPSIYPQPPLTISILQIIGYGTSTGLFKVIYVSRIFVSLLSLSFSLSTPFAPLLAYVHNTCPCPRYAAIWYLRNLGCIHNATTSICPQVCLVATHLLTRSRCKQATSARTMPCPEAHFPPPVCGTAQVGVLYHAVVLGF
jgi:hypothetical protein